MSARQARRVLQARRMRIARIRKTVATLSIVVFVALFSTIYLQMASGRDPVLGTQASTANAASTPRPTSAAASGEESSQDDSTTNESSPGAGFATVPTPAPSAPLTPMTTSQS